LPLSPISQWEAVLTFCKNIWDMLGMGDSSYRLNFDQAARRMKSNTTARKSVLEWVKLQRLVAKCCKMKKI
jgi:hypothetical protein